VHHVFLSGVIGTNDARLNRQIFLCCLGAVRNTSRGALVEAVDEFGLTASSSLIENAAYVRAGCRFANIEPRRGGEKPVAANDFAQNACLSGGEPEPLGEAIDISSSMFPAQNYFETALTRPFPEWRKLHNVVPRAPPDQGMPVSQIPHLFRVGRLETTQLFRKTLP
jgi:hypothetical protein